MFILSALPLVAAPEGLRLNSKTHKELKNEFAYQEAEKAMADSLPGVAAEKFRILLESTRLSNDAKSAVKLMLAEALVRQSSRMGGDTHAATQALEILNDETLSTFSTRDLWKAEALATLGKYNEAANLLAILPKSHAMHSEAKLARARIFIALQRHAEALELLQELTATQKTEVKNTAALLATELAIESNDIETAKKFLERASAQDDTTIKLKEYLTARLTLNEGKAAEAVSLFQSLISSPAPLKERLYLTCYLGLSDAQVANNDKEAATSTLIRFIEDHPNASNLLTAFERLLTMVPSDAGPDNPIRSKLKEWCNEKNLPETWTLITPAPNSIKGITTEQLAPTDNPDLVALAHFFRAKLLIKTKSENNIQQAKAILSRLRMLHSTGGTSPSNLYLELFSASLLETAYIHLQAKDTDMATFTLATLEKITFSPKLKNQSFVLRGEILASKDDYEGAMQAFMRARETTDASIMSAASLNAGIMALKSSNLNAFDQLTEATSDKQIKQSLTLERALWKCYQGDISGRDDLDTFIMAHKNHPREDEARLALAAACVNTSPPDIKLAKAQIDIIAPRMNAPAQRAKITRVLIRAESLNLNWSAAAKTAEAFITKYPDSTDAPSIQMMRGEAYFHNKDYNKAQIIFQNFNERYPDNVLTPYADFYAAMAARLSGTEQSREECIGMFQKIIDAKHPLSSEARIQQGRVLIDLRRYDEARQSLSPLLENKKALPNEKLGAGVLMADCLQREGNIDPQKNKEAITIYDDLLKTDNLSQAWKHRLHYLRGQAYENMKETSEAFKSYYDVIITAQPAGAQNNQPEEWLWFYRCGFKALAMLENAQRWESSVKVAKRIAAFNGPRAEEAAKRADDLAKKHMIWSEDEPIKPIQKINN